MQITIKVRHWIYGSVTCLAYAAGGITLLPSLPLFIASVAVSGVVGIICFFVAAIWDMERIGKTITLPSRRGRLQKRLRDLVATEKQMLQALQSIPEDSPHAKNLRSRVEQIEGAKQALKTELVYEELAALDRRAGKQIRREIG